MQWAIGIAERELGHLDAAAAELRAGVDLANDAGDATLAAGLKVTLAVVVGRLGDLDGALVLLDDRRAAAHGSRTWSSDAEPGHGALLARGVRRCRDNPRVSLPSTEARTETGPAKHELG